MMQKYLYFIVLRSVHKKCHESQFGQNLHSIEIKGYFAESNQYPLIIFAFTVQKVIYLKHFAHSITLFSSRKLKFLLYLALFIHKNNITIKSPTTTLILIFVILFRALSKAFFLSLIIYFTQYK